MIENSYQRLILSKCSFFKDGAKYSDLAIKEIENDLFNYHLQKLVKDGFLERKDRKYFLSQKGKSLVTNIDEISKHLATNYKVSVYMCALQGNKILLHKRLKHPQYGYVGFPSGKIKFGDEALSTAKREFKEETNLDADFKIIGNLRQIRKDKEGNVIEDGVFYICLATNISGELTTKFLEGENFWHDISKVSEIPKLFKPSVEIIVNEIQKRVDSLVSWEDKFVFELLPEPEEY